VLNGGVQPQLSKGLAAVWLVPAIFAVGLMLLTRARNPRARATALRTLRWITVAYILGTILITLWPLHFDTSHHGLARGNNIPFHGTLGFVTSPDETQQRIGDLDFLANVLLYIPLGLLIPFAIDRPGGVLITLVITAGLALGLEILQGAVIAERTFDIDDAISGFAGALLGAVAAAILRPIARVGLVSRRL
jgi:glycopeptide antibiotics resistance protein